MTAYRFDALKQIKLQRRMTALKRLIQPTETARLQAE